MVMTTLENRVKNVLGVLEKSGYSKSTVSNYHIAFKRLLKKAAEMQIENLTEELAEKFVNDSEDSRKGGYSHSRKCFQLSCIRKLEECEEKGYVGWKPYIESKIEAPESVEFKNLHTDFLNHLEAEGKSKNTISSYRNVSCRLLIFIEKTDRKNMSAVSKALILNFFIELQKTWNPGSFRTAASAIKSFLIFSEQIELLAAVPEKLSKKRAVIPVLTQDEELAVWSAINSDAVCPRDKAVVLLLLLTGMRAIDIINLKLSDIDWNCDIISITQKKTGKTLTLPLVVFVN
jgi:site-specific recombinase XerD